MSELDDNALQELIAFACGLADAAGAAILPFFRAGIAVENKRT
ncbi:MAG TPA: histidinol-phosphatase, partial [Alphaproteobacteria bacterium]|nr:histidinol-phosphatase [Alphaproteobacteria bacterium]